MMNEFIVQSIRTILYDKLSSELTENEVSILIALPRDETLALLRNEFENARDAYISWRAFRAVMNMSGFDKVQFLIALLSHSSDKWRITYCQSLAKFHDQRVLRKLCEIYTKDHDANLRYRVAELLTTIGDESLIKMIEIEQFTDDRSDDFPIAAVTKRVIQKIRKNLTSKPPTNHRIEQSNSFVPQDVQKLLEQWANEIEPTSKLRLFEAILHAEKFDKIQWLDNLLDKSTTGWRSAYVEELSKYYDQRAVDFLSTILLHDPDPDLRYVTAQSLAINGDATALAALEYAVKHDTGTDYEGRPIADMAVQAMEVIHTRMAK